MNVWIKYVVYIYNTSFCFYRQKGVREWMRVKFLLWMNENLYIAHKKLCVFTEPVTPVSTPKQTMVTKTITVSTPKQTITHYTCQHIKVDKENTLYLSVHQSRRWWQRLYLSAHQSRRWGHRCWEPDCCRCSQHSTANRLPLEWEGLPHGPVWDPWTLLSIHKANGHLF